MGLVAFFAIAFAVIAADCIVEKRQENEEKIRICKMADKSRRHDAIKNPKKRFPKYSKAGRDCV